MKARTFVVLAVAVATLGTGSLSFAQGYGPGPRHDDRRDQRYDHRHGPRHDHRVERRDYRPAPPRHVYYPGARGPEFQRGRYIPREYRRPQYVVTNYRTHHLYAPPRGYHWVQVGGDYVLVAIATGLIASLILSR